MSLKKFATSILSIGALSTILLTGAPTASAALGFDIRQDEQSSSNGSYTRGYRDGFRSGFRDGFRDGRETRRSFSLRRLEQRDEYERGFAVAYERGYKEGFDRARRNKRDRDRNDDHKREVQRER